MHLQKYNSFDNNFICKNMLDPNPPLPPLRRIILLTKCIVVSLRPHGDPQMIRFGAHLVLVLRYLLTDELKDPFRKDLMDAGDLIIHMYVITT